jgi:hypothetical protein
MLTSVDPPLDDAVVLSNRFGLSNRQGACMTPLRRRMTEDMQVRSFSRAPALQTEQLKDVATVDRFSFQGLEMSDGKPVKDDLLKISTDSYRSNAKIIKGLLRF